MLLGVGLSIALLLVQLFSLPAYIFTHRDHEELHRYEWHIFHLISDNAAPTPVMRGAQPRV